MIINYTNKTNKNWRIGKTGKYNPHRKRRYWKLNPKLPIWRSDTSRNKANTLTDMDSPQRIKSMVKIERNKSSISGTPVGWWKIPSIIKAMIVPKPKQVLLCTENQGKVFIRPSTDAISQRNVNIFSDGKIQRMKVRRKWFLSLLFTRT